MILNYKTCLVFTQDFIHIEVLAKLKSWRGGGGNRVTFEKLVSHPKASCDRRWCNTQLLKLEIQWLWIAVVVVLSVLQ